MRKTISQHAAYWRKHSSIQEYAITLLQLVYDTDEDGRDIGYDYGIIRTAILRKFPTVSSSGPHRGRPTKIPFKELWEISCELNRNDVKLPFRPRRPRGNTSKKNPRH